MLGCSSQAVGFWLKGTRKRMAIRKWYPSMYINKQMVDVHTQSALSNRYFKYYVCIIEPSGNAKWNCQRLLLFAIQVTTTLAPGTCTTSCTCPSSPYGGKPVKISICYPTCSVTTKCYWINPHRVIAICQNTHLNCRKNHHVWLNHPFSLVKTQKNSEQPMLGWLIYEPTSKKHQ